MTPDNPKKHRWRLTVFITVILIGLCAGLLVYVVRLIREESRRMRESEQLRQIAVGLLEYEQNYKCFPPAYTLDDAGNKLHSWRTVILQYSDFRNVYQMVDFTKPWDAPENAKARDQVIENYQSELARPGETLFRAIIDPRGIFTGGTSTQSKAITDDRYHTLLVVQSARDQATHWMKPDEYTLDDFLKIDKSNSAYSNGYTQVLNAVGNSRQIQVQSMNRQQLEALLTINGHEPVTFPKRD